MEEDLDIPTILRKDAADARKGERPAAMGVAGARKNIVHPDLQYEESELDVPPFLRKAD